MIRPANRLQNTSEYYFSKKLKEVKQLIENGKPVINLGIGSPDLQPDKDVVQAMISATHDEKAHQYQPYLGIDELRHGIKNFYKSIYNVELNADKNILPLMGSKEGILHISMAYLNPGDHVLIPNPGYPTYAAVAGLAEAKIDYYDLNEDNSWQPKLSQLESLIKPRTKLMWINYPHMPTGSRLNPMVLKKLIHLCKAHNILLVNDNPYSLILTSNPTSVLSQDWPNRHVLELNSMSKTFNLSGWRIGMLCGHEELIYNVLKVKSNMDSGMFYPLQKGGVKALSQAKDWLVELNKTYSKRRTLMWKLCDSLKLSYDKNTSGLFVWAKLKEGISAKDFSDTLLHKYDMFVTPGDVFGTNGKGFVRFSLCVTEEDIQTCIERIKMNRP